MAGVHLRYDIISEAKFENLSNIQSKVKCVMFAKSQVILQYVRLHWIQFMVYGTVGTVTINQLSELIQLRYLSETLRKLPKCSPNHSGNLCTTDQPIAIGCQHKSLSSALIKHYLLEMGCWSSNINLTINVGIPLRK